MQCITHNTLIYIQEVQKSTCAHADLHRKRQHLSSLYTNTCIRIHHPEKKNQDEELNVKLLRYEDVNI